jgi:hypothetical protein
MKSNRRALYPAILVLLAIAAPEVRAQRGRVVYHGFLRSRNKPKARRQSGLDASRVITR